MKRHLRRAVALVVSAVALALVVPVAPANAHGETAQESFLRMGTIAFWDVEYSTDTVKQGEEVTLTGTAKILETWPEQLGEPEMGFIGVIAPGPVVVVQERLINGQPAPMAIEVEKGGVYQFEITLVGRRVGKWHIHPIFGIHGAGSLLGPGQYIDVQDGGGFTNDLKLVSGETVNLETLGLGSLTFWSLVWLAVGFAWLLYWIVPKPTVTRLPVTSQIPLNTDGGAYGLITKKDHRAMNLIMAATLALVIGGMLWQAQAYPVKLPQQVLRFAPQTLAMDEDFVSASAVDAVFEVESNTVVMTVNVTNDGDSPATVTEFTTSTLSFPVAEQADGERSLQVSPSPTIAPGETTTLKLSISDEVWTEERLMPVGESRMQVTGVLRFKDGSGRENFTTIQSFVQPSRLD